MEPANEMLLNLNGNAESLLETGNDKAQDLRHPAMDHPYYWEYLQIADALSGLFRKSFSYDDYFVDEPSGLSLEQIRFFSALINNAKARPVLQFCRSAGRIKAFKKQFGGVHIYLWREPRNQWWSFKINNYFDALVQLIYNAAGLPAALNEIKKQSGIRAFHDDDIQAEFVYAHQHPLGAQANYFAFYGLWLYAFLEGKKHADITVSIDKLSNLEECRSATASSLSKSGIQGLDFSDCVMQPLAFSDGEKAFFSSIELQVQDIFLRHGYPKDQIEYAVEMQKSVMDLGVEDLAAARRDAIQARAVALRLLDRAEDFERELSGAKIEIINMKNSLSWRITQPLRQGKAIIFKWRN